MLGPHEARCLVERRGEGGGDYRADAGHTAQPPHHRVSLDDLFETFVGQLDLLVEYGDGPALMRQPSRRASAPISEMYFERVRMSASRTDK